MAGLLLAALKDQVRSLCFEENGDLGLFTESRLSDIIQIAHRELYGFISRIAPVELATQSADVSITSSGFGAGSGMLSASAVAQTIPDQPNVRTVGGPGSFTITGTPTSPGEFMLVMHGGVSAIDDVGDGADSAYLFKDGAFVGVWPLGQSAPFGGVFLSDFAAVGLVVTQTAVGTSVSKNYLLGDTYSFTVSNADSSVDANGVHDIYRVELKDANGNYKPLQYVPFNDIGMRGSNSSDSDCEIRWTRLGQTIHLVPAQTAAQTCRILYVKAPALIDDVASYPFNGALSQFHHIISFRAADIAMTKDEKPSKYAATYGQMKRELEEHLRRPHASGPRKVRMNPHGD